MLAPIVIGAGVVHAPIGARERFLALDERVTQLVKDHLGEAVVGVERLDGPDRERAAAIGRRIRVRRPDHLQADAARGREPDLRQRIDIASGYLAGHGLASSTKTCRHARAHRSWGI